MATKAMTFEEVDRIVQRADLKAFKPGGKHHVTARAVSVSPGDVIGKICPIWSIVKPILSGVSVFLPKKWKDALAVFTNVMDTICSAS